MSRVYLSGPITGIEGYKRKFEGWKDKLVACGYDVVNPAELTSVIGERVSAIWRSCRSILTFFRDATVWHKCQDGSSHVAAILSTATP